MPKLKKVAVLSKLRSKTFNSLNFSKTLKKLLDKLNDKSQDIKRVAVVGAGYIALNWLKLSNVMERSYPFIDVVDTCLAGYYDHDLTDLYKI